MVWVRAVQNHLMEMEARRAAAPTWDTVRYMIAQIQYGGRITDDFDALLMRTYAARFFHQVPHHSTQSPALHLCAQGVADSFGQASPLQHLHEG